MNFKMPKLSDALLGGFLLGLLLLGLVVVCFLSRRKSGLFGRRQSIPHEDIASISRRYQSYQDCATVPYAHGNPSQIDRVDIVNISVISANLANQESSYLYRNATFVRNMTR